MPAEVNWEFATQGMQVPKKSFCFVGLNKWSGWIEMLRTDLDQLLEIISDIKSDVIKR